FFSSRRRHTRFSRDWSSDVCSSDLQNAWVSLLRRISPKETCAITRQPGLQRLTIWHSSSNTRASLWLRSGRALNSDFITILNCRSEERRVGKECRSRWSSEHETARG